MWTGDASLDGFGTQVGFVGDTDGDGLDDFVVAADPTEGGSTAFLYAGASIATLPATPMQSATATMADEPQWQRQGVYPAGDVDADGHDDFWVAAPFRLVHGTATGAVDLTASDVTIRVGGDGARSLIASTADVDGDGIRDLLASTGSAVYLFKGPFAPGEYDVSDASLTVLADSGDTIRGTAAVADLDGDGLVELVVGVDALAWNAAGTSVNVAGIPATTTGTVQLSDTSAMSWWIPYRAGWSRAASAGDVNADGHTDLILGGAGWAVVPGPLAGEVDPSTAALLTFDPQPGVAFPPSANRNVAVGTLGDLDGDGADEIFALQTGPAAPEDERPDGALYVVRGNRQGPIDTSTADAVWTGQPADDSTAAVVSADGDADGDGLHDVLIGVLGSPRDPQPGHVYWLPGASLLQP